MHDAGSSCALKLPAHLTIHLAPARPSSHGCKGGIHDDYLPLGLPTALPARPLLAGSSNPLLAASGWVETEVGPLTGLELEANRLPTATLVRTLLPVFAVSTLTLSLLSWISMTSAAIWAAAAPRVEVFWLVPWIVPTEKSSWKRNATFGSTWAFVRCLLPLSWDRSFT